MAAFLYENDNDNDIDNGTDDDNGSHNADNAYNNNNIDNCKKTNHKSIITIKFVEAC